MCDPSPRRAQRTHPEPHGGGGGARLHITILISSELVSKSTPVELTRMNESVSASETVCAHGGRRGWGEEEEVRGCFNYLYIIEGASSAARKGCMSVLCKSTKIKAGGVNICDLDSHGCCSRLQRSANRTQFAFG